MPRRSKVAILRLSKPPQELCLVERALCRLSIDAYATRVLQLNPDPVDAEVMYGQLATGLADQLKHHQCYVISDRDRWVVNSAQPQISIWLGEAEARWLVDQRVRISDDIRFFQAMANATDKAELHNALLGFIYQLGRMLEF